MKTSVIIALLLIAITGNAFSEELDSYYLKQFGEKASSLLETSLKEPTPDLIKCGMPLRKGLRTDWSKLESSTQNILAKYLTKPVLSGENTYASSGGHFIIHYATSGIDAPPLTATPPLTVPNWVINVADVFEYVYNQQVSGFGYRAPSAPVPYPIYLKQLATAALYGSTDSDTLTGQSATSYITIDNDFADTIYFPYNGLPGLQITAAHEFHHAIQFDYNYYFDIWYAEATSSWMEDEVYDAVNQLYDYSKNYLQNPSTSLDLPGDGGYGRWIFNRLLTETHSSEFIRLIWEDLRNTESVNGNDIPMLPVIDRTLRNQQSSLAGEFNAFAKRFYAKNWTTHTNELNRLYAIPLAMAATYVLYPVNQESYPSSTANLLHHSMKYFKFVPTATVPNLTITVNRTAGIQTALFKKTSVDITEIPINSGNNPTSYTYSISGFGSLDPVSDEIVLMAANTTFVDNHMVSFSSDGSVRSITDPQTTPPPTGGTSSASKGCFIATAAYGSYLHPKVVLLRKFRDTYLLTNLPGRTLVAAYYELSPPLAAYISRHEPLRLVTRLILAPLVFAVEHLCFALAAVSCCAWITLLLVNRLRKRQLLYLERT